MWWLHEQTKRASAMRVKQRFSLLLTTITIVPQCFCLYFLSINNYEAMQLGMAIQLVLALAVALPFSGACNYFIIGRDISNLYRFCKTIKEGDYSGFYVLPNEQEGESEIIKLKRLLNWMVFNLSKKERAQQHRLQKTEDVKQHYQNLSMKDSLTQLFNRRCFSTHLRLLIDEALHHKSELCLILIDVDNFKQINDSLGHQEGDNLLKILANILQNSTRVPNNMPFRYGGDEFGLIIPNISAEQGGIVAERIRHIYSCNAPEITSLSIGVAMLSHTHKSPEVAMDELIKVADEGVYIAKRNHRNSVVIEGRRQHTNSLSMKKP